MTRRDAWWRSTATREPWRFDTPKPDDGPPPLDPDRSLARAFLVCCVLFCAAVLVWAVVRS